MNDRRGAMQQKYTEPASTTYCNIVVVVLSMIMIIL